MYTYHNEPAFPMTDEIMAYGQAGLTKREYFAAMALSGYIAAGSTGMPLPEKLVDLAVKTADFLIDELNKNENHEGN